MTPAIDLDHLDQYVCGDRSLLDEILTIFDEQAEHWLGQLDPSLDDDDWQNAAHALKGASRGVGAWALGDLCETAEGLIGGVPEKTAKRRELLVEMKASIEAAIGEARRLRDSAISAA